MTLEVGEKHLNRFCKLCYDAGCMYAKIELGKETERGNFWAKKYQKLEKETKQKLADMGTNSFIAGYQEAQAETTNKIEELITNLGAEFGIDSNIFFRIKMVFRKVLGDTQSKHFANKTQ